jgi:RNA methyltransferase, TrmH family
MRAAYAAGVEVTQVTERAAAALSDAVTPRRASSHVARCAIPDTDPAALLAGSPTLPAVLVQTNDPGNAGTVIRLAGADGADGVTPSTRSTPRRCGRPQAACSTCPWCARPILSRRSACSPGRVCPCWPPPGRPPPTWTPPGPREILDLPTARLFGSQAHGLPQDAWRPSPTNPYECRSTVAPSR